MAVPGTRAERAIPNSYQRIACDTAQSLTVPDGTSLILITAEAQALRYRDDGPAPTATNGVPIAAGSTLRYDAMNTKQIQLIGQVAGGFANAAYYTLGV